MDGQYLYLGYAELNIGGIEMENTKKKKRRKNTIQFRNRIKEVREEKGITVSQLAMALGKTPSMVYNMEKKGGLPRGDTREKLKKFFHVGFSDLFYEVEENEGSEGHELF